MIPSPDRDGSTWLTRLSSQSGATFTPTSALQKYIRECEGILSHNHVRLVLSYTKLPGKTPLERAELLRTTPLFTSLHAESASSGQSSQVTDTDLHFTCFVEAPEADVRTTAQELSFGKEGVRDLKEGMKEGSLDGEQTSGMRLIELDGRRAGPVDHGECKDLLVVSIIITSCAERLEG